MHPTLQQLELALQQAPAPSALDVAFVQRSFCVAGLPLREPKTGAGDGPATFSRRGNGFNLSLTTVTRPIPDTDITVQIGVPYGPRARLLTIWMASQPILGTSRFVELGQIKEWLTHIGIKSQGRGISETKAQLIKLSNTSFSITIRGMIDGNDVTAFRNENLIAGAVIGTEDLLHFHRGEMDKVRWPLGIEISEGAWSRFEKDAIPIPMNRLREISSHATAIDMFLYLSYRLPLIPEGKNELVPWRQLASQFGLFQGNGSKFRKDYSAAIALALKAYPEAKIEDTPDGLLMFHSDRAGDPRTFISMSSQTPKKHRRARRNRVDLGGITML